MLSRIQRIVRNQDGASAVEYGLLVAAIAAVIIVVIFAFGGFVTDIFNETCNTIQSTVNANPGLGGALTTC